MGRPGAQVLGANEPYTASSTGDGTHFETGSQPGAEEEL